MFPNCYYFSKLDKKSCPSLTKDSFLILMKNYFNNSYSELVSAFTQKESFTIEQLEELKNMIDKALNK